MTWAQAVAAWCEWMRAGDLSPETVRLRRYQVLRLVDVGPAPGMVTAARLQAFLAAQEWAPETRRGHLAAFRSFFAWALREGVVRANPAVDLPRARPSAGVPRPAGESAIDAALMRADERQHVMLMLASRHGLRRGEISRVHSDDVIEAPGGWSLVVHGKGRKERLVPLLPATAHALRARPAGWAFPNGKGDHLTAGHVGVLITRALPKGVTPHQLRHRFATVVYRRTLDIRRLQQLLGHASVATTQRYCAADDATARAVLAAAA